MIRAKHFINAVAVGLLILLASTTFLTEPTNAAYETAPPPNARLTGPTGPDLLRMVPAESLFCLRINNFDYTVNMMDQFLAGISPMPLGLSMVVRMQMAGLLGNPQLTGLDMGASIAVFGMPASPQSAATADGAGMLVILMLPVTDYNQFLNASPNCGQPDARGVSEITAQNLPKMLVVQANDFALIAEARYGERLVATARSMSSMRAPALAGVVDAGEADLAAKDPVWLYVHIQNALAFAGPLAAQQLPQLKMLMPEAAPGANATAQDLEKLSESIQLQSLAMSIIPEQNVLRIGATVVAVPGTKLADTFAAGSTEFRNMADQVGAKPPAQLGPNLDAILALLAQADKADFAGTYSLTQLFDMAAAISPNAPKIDVQAKSSLAFALTARNGKMYVDAALPKEHLTEIMVAFLDAQQPTPPDGMQVTEPDFGFEETPTEPEGPGRSDMAIPQVTGATAAGQGSAAVAAVRLVRHSDYDAGIMPLGQSAGYTLALIAQLPEPSVKVLGGSVDKATTDSGKSLLPKDTWDRKVRLPKLAKDHQTVVFEVALLLPDESARGMEEIAGSLEFLTATSTKKVDLGATRFEVGAKAEQFGAVITSLEVDPWSNNATILGVKLDRSVEAIESVECLAQDGTPLAASLHRHVSIGGASLLTILVNGKLPPDGRIVLNLYDQLQKNQLAFKVLDIALTGEPLL